MKITGESEWKVDFEMTLEVKQDGRMVVVE